MSTISFDMVFRAFCNPSKSNGSFVCFFLESSLKVTFLDFRSSITDFFSRAIIRFSTAIASFMLSAKVDLLALSTKIAMFDGRAVIYHSHRTSSLGWEAVGILLKILLKRKLKSLIGSLVSALRLDKSLINVAIDLSSPNSVRNYSWKMFQLVIDLEGNEKYHDPAVPLRV